MTKLIKKIKEHFFTLFILLCILTIGAFINIEGSSESSIDKLIGSLFLGVLGICFIIWHNKIGLFDYNWDKLWPRFEIIKISEKKLLTIYEKKYLFAGLFLIVVSVRSILSVLFKW